MEDLIFSEEMFNRSLLFEESDSLMSALLKHMDENPGTSTKEALKVVNPKLFGFTEETLTTYIPTVMVDAPKEASTIEADKADIGVSLIDD